MSSKLYRILGPAIIVVALLFNIPTLANESQLTPEEFREFFGPVATKAAAVQTEYKDVLTRDEVSRLTIMAGISAKTEQFDFKVLRMTDLANRDLAQLKMNEARQIREELSTRIETILRRAENREKGKQARFDALLQLLVLITLSLVFLALLRAWKPMQKIISDAKKEVKELRASERRRVEIERKRIDPLLKQAIERRDQIVSRLAEAQRLVNYAEDQLHGHRQDRLRLQGELRVAINTDADNSRELEHQLDRVEQQIDHWNRQVDAAEANLRVAKRDFEKAQLSVNDYEVELHYLKPRRVLPLYHGLIPVWSLITSVVAVLTVYCAILLVGSLILMFPWFLYGIMTILKYLFGWFWDADIWHHPWATANGKLPILSVIIRTVILVALAALIYLPISQYRQRRRAKKEETPPEKKGEQKPLMLAEDRTVSSWAPGFVVESFFMAAVYFQLPFFGVGKLLASVGATNWKWKPPFLRKVLMYYVPVITHELHDKDEIQTLGIPEISQEEDDFLADHLKFMGDLAMPPIKPRRQGAGEVKAAVSFRFQIAVQVFDLERFLQLSPNDRENPFNYVQNLITGRAQDAIPMIWWSDTLVLLGEHLLVGRLHHIIGVPSAALRDAEDDSGNSRNERLLKAYPLPEGRLHWAHLNRFSYRDAIREFLDEGHRNSQKLLRVLHELDLDIDGGPDDELDADFFNVDINERQERILAIVSPDCPLIQIRRYGLRVDLFERQQTVVSTKLKELLDEETAAKLRRRVARTTILQKLDESRGDVIERIMNAKASGASLSVRLEEVTKKVAQMLEGIEEKDEDALRTLVGEMLKDPEKTALKDIYEMVITDELLRTQRSAKEGSHFIVPTDLWSKISTLMSRAS